MKNIPGDKYILFAIVVGLIGIGAVIESIQQLGTVLFLASLLIAFYGLGKE